MPKMKKGDPAYWMLTDGVTSTPTVNNPDCYICRDPEFAQMGLPLCYACLICGAHVPADDHTCDEGHQQPTDPIENLQIRKEHNLPISWEMIQQAKELVDDTTEEWFENAIKEQSNGTKI